jgi:hypothetical protein
LKKKLLASQKVSFCLVLNSKNKNEQIIKQFKIIEEPGAKDAKAKKKPTGIAAVSVSRIKFYNFEHKFY